MATFAPIKARSNRPFLRRILVDILAIAVITALALRYGPTAWYQAKLLYVQHQCLNHTAPADQIVYISQPNQAPQLQTMSETFEDHDTPGEGHPDGADGACEILPPHILPPGAVGDPPYLAEYNRYLQFALEDYAQVLFCHRLTTAAGDQRLVIVEYGPNLLQQSLVGLPQGRYTILILQPATLISGPRLLARQQINATDRLIPLLTTRFHAGQYDAANPAAFTLTYQTLSTTTTLAGALTADGKHVTLTEK